ncbi:hypothetical protein ACT3CD_03610 [Geofilum sp. OHC36d9]|uniref:hypothetical protein n=1 Tax=Geofilum sp. OHC36d9 TaxID=3458413 RepID=UPI0040343B88
MVNDYFEDKRNAEVGLCLEALFISLINKTQVLDKKGSNSRLAQSEKCEFTLVNDHFEDKGNAEAGLCLEALFISLINKTQVLDKKSSNSRLA